MGVTVFYVGAGIAVLAVSLVTNYQYGSTAAGKPVTATKETRKPATKAAIRPAGSRRTEPLRAASR